jgi:hypothetical protein
VTPYKFDIPAGGEVPIAAQGSRYYVRSTTGALSIRTGGKMSGIQTTTLTGLRAGQGLVGVPFDYLLVKNETAGAVAVELVVSDGDFRNDRMTIEGGALGVSDTIVEDTDTFDTTPATITPVAGQIRVTFRCRAGNSDNIKVAGVWYGAGEGNTIATTATINVVADAAGQDLDWYHEVQS